MAMGHLGRFPECHGMTEPSFGQNHRHGHHCNGPSAATTAAKQGHGLRKAVSSSPTLGGLGAVSLAVGLQAAWNVDG